MKTGKSIVELAQELQRIKENSKDFIVPTEALAMDVVTDDAGVSKPVLAFQNGERHRFDLNSWSHSQLSGYAEVPKQYYDRLRGENPNLLAQNVNHGLSRQIQPGKRESRMLRTVGNDLRGLVSSKFRRLDNYDLVETTLPVAIEHGFQVESSEITDRKLYLKMTTPKIQAEVKPGDAVQFGLVISGSDVGAGAVTVEPLVYRLVCKNGLIMNTAMRKSHIGRNLATDDIMELVSERTRDLTDAAFWAQVRDVVLASMRPEIFDSQVNRLREAAGEKITNFDIPEVVELAMRSTNVTGEKTKESMIAYLANGADGAGLTRWGLVNAFTYAAQLEHVGYDESTDLERSASRILELPKKSWEQIAASA